MRKGTIVGYPRIGVNRELKKVTESYFKEKIDSNELLGAAKMLRKEYLETQKEKGIDLIPVNDFSFYDQMLDTMVLVNCIPKRYQQMDLPPIDEYFAMARGYQKGGKDIKALAMKKWFNTNYHYLVPEIEDDVCFGVNKNAQVFSLIKEANELGINCKAVIIGFYTFLKLSKLDTPDSFEKYVDKLIPVYQDIISKIDCEWIQIDEPILVTDLTDEDVALFTDAYEKLLAGKGKKKILLQTYFGDVRDIYENIIKLDFDGIGLDFIEGPKNLDLLEKYGFPNDKYIFAGVVNGKNIWINDYKKSLAILETAEKYTDKVYISTSCSLLHVPHTLRLETDLPDQFKESMAFAEEKLAEITNLKDMPADLLEQNQIILERKKKLPGTYEQDVRDEVDSLQESDFIRADKYEDRIKIQDKIFNLPYLPTTTIGSFPQTADVKALRAKLASGEITTEEYESGIRKKIDEIIKLQEEIGLDVLVHGEYERNDMVEYFGQQLNGFVRTKNGWVQSYGTRGVKPPVIFGDVKREKPMTVRWITYAQSKADRPVKGMLTGPITIMNWSFIREDLPIQKIAYQIGIAMRTEVLDLEKAGIKVIQIDEAALREKLPIRHAEWDEYLEWAIKAFRLTHSKVQKETQIHTHMCYSEFADILKAIENMDTDVITIEAARSDFSLLDFIKAVNFKPQIGLGIYDIHSPRVPSVEELVVLINKLVAKLELRNIWINPDCGLKTRGMEETKASLINMVKAAKQVRETL